MNSKIASFISSAILISGVAQAKPSTPRYAQPELVSVDVVDMFVPNGFDSNDEIVVVLDGYLPNSCYRLTRPEIEIDQATRVIKITQMARRFPGPCIVPLVPFTNVIHVGALDSGNYQVSTNKGMLLKNLTVELDPGTGAYGPDDFLYAPVDSVSVSRTSDGRFEAKINGRFTNDCMEFEDVRLLHKGRVIELLPILKNSAGVTCQPTEKPFNKSVRLPDELLVGRNLVHVRSLNGSSINTVFSVPPAN